MLTAKQKEYVEKQNYTGKSLTEAKTRQIKARLEELRKAIQEENISYGEIAELQGLAKYIDKGDVELLQWAGVKE